MGKLRPRMLVWLLALMPALAACGAKTGLPIPDAGEDAGPDAGPPCPEGSPVDVLLVVDNSNSMAEEQATLAEQIPLLIESLVVPPDLDDDGTPDWNPIRNLHLGLVSTDLGGAGHPVGTCMDADGDDGILRNTGSDEEGCRSEYPRFLSYDGRRPGRRDEFIEDVGCLAEMGTEGCGFEHHLEASLKAVTPDTSSLRFRGEPGHGNGINDGFLRPDSLFALLVLTDEDDCSLQNLELMNPDNPRFHEVLNFRCTEHPDALHPLDRYVDGFLSLRDDASERFAFALIGGVPPDLARDPLDVDYDRILSDPRMEPKPDPENPMMLAPSCESDSGRAHPPRRLVRFAKRFSDRSAIQSVCSDDYRPALLAFARLIADPPCP